jgi:hypothetical protein
MVSGFGQIHLEQLKFRICAKGRVQLLRSSS